MYINTFKVLEALWSNEKPDVKALLAGVDRRRVMAALITSKAGLPKPVPYTDEPMEEVNQAKMSWWDKQKLRAIFARLKKDPGRDLRALLALKEKYPQVPSISNYLCLTYQGLRQWDDFKKVVDETIREFPAYLFGKTALAEYCLGLHDLKGVARALDNTFELPLLYPERKTFHVSEVRAFYSVVGAYFARSNRLARALYCYFLLEEFAQDHPTTVRVGNEIVFAEYGKLRREMAKRGVPKGRRGMRCDQE